MLDQAAACTWNARLEWGRIQAAGECWPAKQHVLGETEQACMLSA